MTKLLKSTGVLLLATCVLSADPKISKDLEGAASQGLVRVNVRYKWNVDAGKHAEIGKRHGGTLSRANDNVRAATFRLPAASAAALARDPDIEYVSLDRPVRGALDYTVETSGAHIAAQYGYDGRTIGIAIIDSGIRDSKDFKDAVTGKSRLVYSESLLPACTSSTASSSGSPGLAAETMLETGSATLTGTTDCSTQTSSQDYYGHGTHVAGIIGSSGQYSTGGAYRYTIRGIAPRVNLVNLRVLDENGVGYDSYVIAAINRAIQLKSTYNIRVINLSLGRSVMESYVTDPLTQAVKAAWEAGIVVVCSAGNRGRDNSMNTQGYGTISSPGNSPWVVTVGAMKTQSSQPRPDDTIASYSSKGPTLLDHVVKPDLVAPGNRVESVQCSNCRLTVAFPANRTPYESYTKNQKGASAYYFSLSGTSMATPVVSGAAVLLLQKDPSLTPDQVKARLMKSATKTFPSQTSVVENGVTYISYYDIFTVGAGYLDIWAALNSTGKISSRALSPLAVFDAATGRVKLMYANNVIWGDNVIWGANVIWGERLLTGSNVIWGDSAVWNGVGASNVIWGENVIWGDNTTGSNAELNGEN